MNVRCRQRRGLAFVAGLLTAVCTLVGSSVCRAQAAPACPPEAVALTPERVKAGMAEARDHGFLWRIAKEGHASYLYGTIHAARLEWLFPGPSIREALSTADTVALELDLLDPPIRRRLASAMAAYAGAQLPPELQERMRLQMQAECVAPEGIAKMSPELQIATLSVLAARRDGLDPAYSVDLMLASYGRSAGKAVVSLETPEEQLDALKSADPAETLEVVTQALDDLEAGRSRPLMNRIAAAWASGDRRELDHYEDWCECVRSPAEKQAMRRLLTDRNPALADRIDALHRAGRRVFAAVGSLHMVGPLGLPALLAARGYTVEAGDAVEANRR